MAQYRKKPVVIEAFEFDGDLIASHGGYYVPDWAADAHQRGDLYYDSFEGGPPCDLFIKTLEGQFPAISTILYDGRSLKPQSV